jgi:hypothetical protein
MRRGPFTWLSGSRTDDELVDDRCRQPGTTDGQAAHDVIQIGCGRALGPRLPLGARGVDRPRHATAGIVTRRLSLR